MDWYRNEWSLSSGSLSQGNLSIVNGQTSEANVRLVIGSWTKHIWITEPDLIIGIPTEDGEYFVVFTRLTLTPWR